MKNIAKNLLPGLFAIFLTICFSGYTFYLFEKESTPKKHFVVLLDPGHGGLDGGALGINTKIKESEITLKISKSVGTYLTASGFVKVVYTRITDDDLSNHNSSNHKQDDFKKRQSIIENIQPEIVISIHCNKFKQQIRRGGQVFFSSKNVTNFQLAQILQMNINMLNSKYVGKTFSALEGNYFVITCTSLTSVLVECGFLSNPDDERLLSSPSYQDELAKAISRGTMAFLLNAI
ncbi:MAG: N-acetylmuramoyl-L-alanine amidase [Christensenellaceae bacterium]|jgi:N-acetylmuramoyl-L-alanine amidase|nr:N-acetylmuramoyl-L-alanine amidase [Christensenellaceae bacterium]